MIFEPKKFDSLFGTPGFSDEALNTHFTLYQGYVSNTNKLHEHLQTQSPGTPEYSELKRRFGWEFSGMRLHEEYFESLTRNPKPIPTDAGLIKAIEKQFGSFDRWSTDMKGTGMSRGIGWAILTCDPRSSRLFNIWINEHDQGHIVGAVPLLVIDVFEHAFLIDYRLTKADYIEAFFNAMDWEVVCKRYERIDRQGVSQAE